jgi:hypothetical protein
MIRAVYILVEGGICIYSRAYDEALADPLLMSSFISAVTQFSREAMGDELKGIESDGRFVFVSDQDQIDIVIINDDPDEINVNLIENIAMSFLGKYSSQLTGDTGVSEQFKGFDVTLDRIIPPSLVQETTIEPKEPLDGLSIIELPSDLKAIAMLLIREQKLTASRAAREMSLPVSKAQGMLDTIVDLGKAGRRENRLGAEYFI